MARFYGLVGYSTAVETDPGVYENVIETHRYFGDVLRNTSRWENSGRVNDNLNINVQISIVADPFAYQNFQYIKYVQWMGEKWKVTTVEPQYPRILLTLGGVYNDGSLESEDSED